MNTAPQGFGVYMTTIFNNIEQLNAQGKHATLYINKSGYEQLLKEMDWRLNQNPDSILLNECTLKVVVDESVNGFYINGIHERVYSNSKKNSEDIIRKVKDEIRGEGRTRPYHHKTHVILVGINDEDPSYVLCFENQVDKIIDILMSYEEVVFINVIELGKTIMTYQRD